MIDANMSVAKVFVRSGERFLFSRSTRCPPQGDKWQGGRRRPQRHRLGWMQWPEGHTNMLVRGPQATHQVSLWFVRLSFEEAEAVPTFTPAGRQIADTATLKWRDYGRVMDNFAPEDGARGLMSYARCLQRYDDYAGLTNP